MKKSIIFKAFLILGITVITLFTTVGAASVYKTVAASLRPDITVNLDNKLLDLKDTKGEAITPLVVNGSTYLPVRAIANSLGLNVVWDEKALIVYLKRSNPTTEAAVKTGVRGIVKNIILGKDGITFLVDGKKEDDTLYDKASVTVNRETKMYKNNFFISKDFAYNEIKEGDTVDITFKGAIAESYPVMGAADTVKITSPKASLDQSSTNSGSKISIDSYLDMIGLDKEKLIALLKEQPTSIDEGGLMFQKAGIRVWFKNSGNERFVDQIFTQRNDIDFNGAKIGENISNFKKLLGDSVSDKNSDAHFKYKGLFLSVQYDKDTGNTFAAYVLKSDF